MIIEQFLHLGYDNKFFHYSLKDVCFRRLHIDIDKSVRGEIIWRGLDDRVINYAANDVVYLEDIRNQQLEECIVKKCKNGANIENQFVPAIAYLEWCGIKLDVEKWKLKMQENENKKAESKKALDAWFLNFCEVHTNYKKEIPEITKVLSLKSKYYKIDRQGDLFSGFDTKPKCLVNWDSATQVTEVAKIIGFNTKVVDKKTGKSKDSVVEKVLAKQKGIDDKFLDIYFKYKEASKECSTYGQNYIDAINPNTGRIHSVFWQLGAASGRMSCGSSNSNTDLAKLKNLTPSRCKFVQLQNLPADEITRSSFIASEGNYMTSCDYSALESRLGADIYQEPEMLNEFLHGSGDMHSLCAKLVFHEELKDVDVKDIKKVRPDLRKKVKPIEFDVTGLLV